MRFLDTNVIVRYLVKDDQVKAEACFQLFQKVEQGTFACQLLRVAQDPQQIQLRERQ